MDSAAPRHLPGRGEKAVAMRRNMNRESFNSTIFEMDFHDTVGDLKVKIVEHLVEQGVDGASGLADTGFVVRMDGDPIDGSDEDTVSKLLGISDVDERLHSGVRAIFVRSADPEKQEKRVGGRDQELSI